MFGTYDSLNEMLADPYTRIDEKPSEKWGELVKQFVVAAPPPSSAAPSAPEQVKTPPLIVQKLSWAQGVTARALSHATAAKIIDSERIKAEQLSSGDNASAGQIVEITKEQDGAVKAELVLIAVGESEGAWVLAYFKQH